MLKEALGRDTTVYITNPSWLNHRQVFESTGEDERVGSCAFSSNTPTITAAVTSLGTNRPC
jgi:aspartate/tyrosine/aromatic aminotransferase